jgi:hypothetical protein
MFYILVCIWSCLFLCMCLSFGSVLNVWEKKLTRSFCLPYWAFQLQNHFDFVQDVCIIIELLFHMLHYLFCLIQLLICIMFKSLRCLYRLSLSSLIILIFIVLNFLEFHPLHLYLRPFLGVAVIWRVQGAFSLLFLVFLCWDLHTWSPVFSWEF